jgi:hypothetical protein
MRKDRFFYLLGTLTIFLTSCNLADFQFDKLAEPTGLNPVIYRPVSSGTYVVKDYASVPGFGSTPVTLDSLNFNMVSYSLNGMLFNTSGTDSMVVIIKSVNETPMKYRYILSFTGTTMDSGSKLLSAATLNPQGDVIEASHDSLEFKLDSAGVANLGLAKQIDLTVTLYQPDQGTVLANVLKSSQISFKIGFRAPINLFRIKL